MERCNIVTCAWFPNYVWQCGNLQMALKKKILKFLVLTGNVYLRIKVQF